MRERPAVVLIRHGETAANREGRFLSRTDVPLSERGRDQAAALRDQIQELGIGRVLVSPLTRACETASILFGNAPLDIRPELREIDFGAFELLDVAEIEASFPGELERRRASPVDYRPPGGESFRDVARRLRALHEELRLASSVAVVAHRGTLGVLERLLCGVPLDDRTVTPLEPATFRCWFASSRPN